MFSFTLIQRYNLYIYIYTYIYIYICVCVYFLEYVTSWFIHSEGNSLNSARRKCESYNFPEKENCEIEEIKTRSS